jgi:predicted nuclease with TOPRIM domain
MTDDPTLRITIPAPPTIAEVYDLLRAVREEVRNGFTNESLARHEMQRRLESIDRGLAAANDELDLVSKNAVESRALQASMNRRLDEVLDGLRLAQDDLRERVEKLEGHPAHPANGQAED